MLGQVQRQKKKIHIYIKIQSFTHARNGEIRVKSRREGPKEKKNNPTFRTKVSNQTRNECKSDPDLQVYTSDYVVHFKIQHVFTMIMATVLVVVLFFIKRLLLIK